MAGILKGQPLDAIDVTKIANSILDKWITDRDRLESHRIFNEREWSYWHVLSWIAYRDPALLLKIKSDTHLRNLAFYDKSPPLFGEPTPKERKPKAELAKVRGEWVAIDPDTGDLKRLTLINGTVDTGTLFDSKGVRRLWSGQGDASAAQSENASFEIAWRDCKRREALKHYRDQRTQHVRKLILESTYDDR
jgi:hypothetical protein